MGNNMQQVLMDSNQGCCTSWSSPQTSRLPEERWTLLLFKNYLLTILGKRNSCVGTAALCQPPSRSQSWIIRCLLPGMVLSQTTLTPAVMSTTLTENVTTPTVTPVILSSTTPGCSGFNTSTCEPCAPGSKYDNSKSVTVSSDRNPPFFVMLDHRDICFRISTHSCLLDSCHVKLSEKRTADIITAVIKTARTDSNLKNKIKMVLYPSPDTLLCLCCSDPGLCLFPGACLPCTKGFYQPLAGQQQCLPCSRGFYTK